jgi:hypothetical protein
MTITQSFSEDSMLRFNDIIERVKGGACAVRDVLAKTKAKVTAYWQQLLALINLLKKSLGTLT